jgi:hypothetical protein
LFMVSTFVCRSFGALERWFHVSLLQ